MTTSITKPQNSLPYKRAIHIFALIQLIPYLLRQELYVVISKRKSEFMSAFQMLNTIQKANHSNFVFSSFNLDIAPVWKTPEWLQK